MKGSIGMDNVEWCLGNRHLVSGKDLSLEKLTQANVGRKRFVGDYIHGYITIVSLDWRLASR